MHKSAAKVHLYRYFFLICINFYDFKTVFNYLWIKLAHALLLTKKQLTINCREETKLHLNCTVLPLLPEKPVFRASTCFYLLPLNLIPRKGHRCWSMTHKLAHKHFIYQYFSESYKWRFLSIYSLHSHYNIERYICRHCPALWDCNNFGELSLSLSTFTR